MQYWKRLLGKLQINPPEIFLMTLPVSQAAAHEERKQLINTNPECVLIWWIGVLYNKKWIWPVYKLEKARIQYNSNLKIFFMSKFAKYV